MADPGSDRFSGGDINLYRYVRNNAETSLDLLGLHAAYYGDSLCRSLYGPASHHCNGRQWEDCLKQCKIGKAPAINNVNWCCAKSDQGKGTCVCVKLPPSPDPRGVGTNYPGDFPHRVWHKFDRRFHMPEAMGAEEDEMRSPSVTAALPALFTVLLSVLWGSNVGCRSRSTGRRLLPADRGNHRGITTPASNPLDAVTAAHQRFKASVRRTRYALHSLKPFKEVRVPLIFHDGKPFVQASWFGRQIECELDTGTDGILYPQWLHLNAQPLHMPASISVTHGPLTPAEWVVSPEIALGGFSVYNAVVMVAHVPQAAPPAPRAQKVPLLGMQMFLGVIVTIDYASKSLTMRSMDYDLTRKPHRKHSLLSHYPTEHYPTVVVPGTLAGHAVGFMLDTGCESLLINSAFAHRYLSVVPIRFPSGTTWPGIHNVACTLLGQHFTVPLALVDERTYSSDALLGGRWFERHRITLDYYRERVLIEPNVE